MLPELLPLLEERVGVSARDGASLESFLTRELGLDPAYVTVRSADSGTSLEPQDIQVREGMVLELAPTALEGDVLATYEVRAEGEDYPARDVVVWVRFDGVLRAVMAPLLLRRGVLLSMERMGALLQELSEEFWTHSGGVLIKGRRFNPLTHELGLPQSDALILLEVRAPQEESEETS